MRIFLLLSICYLLLSAPMALAASATDFIKPWRLACSDSTDVLTILRDCITKIKPDLLTLAAIVFVLGWLWAGVKLVLGLFSPKAWDEAKNTILYTLGGFALLLIADIIVDFIRYLIAP